MQQVFMNLALNARDAMPTGGKLQFDISILQTEPDQTPPFCDMPPGEWVKICVTDTGSGISAEVVPHIFEPFFTTKSPGEGTGLGLAQVYGIVKQHDGYIDVTSEEGVGTTFIIYLPSKGNREANTTDTYEVPMDIGHGETILIVEDNESMRNALAEVLDSQNYQSLLAEDGQAALDILEQRAVEIDLVLSDLVMPKMSGMKLYETLRERYPDMRVVVMSGYPLNQETGGFLEREGVIRLQKPLTLQNLAQTLRKALSQK
jgi:CheY-like chemotaxis protein